jgi:superfamily II helicase
MFDYFTYRNIIGRAGRMFRYFVGRVFLLVKPPEQADTQLNLNFPDDVALSLDPDNPGVELNQDQRELQRSR